MGYTKEHTEDECDKCLKNVGKNNLTPVPFLYLDVNDRIHPDLSSGYHQYYVCKRCYKIELRTVKSGY
tara:strand:+ start:3128 stop:3331 length:204 start_codon:yes stop_codon:yes gene_type:complete